MESVRSKPLEPDSGSLSAVQRHLTTLHRPTEGLTSSARSSSSRTGRTLLEVVSHHNPEAETGVGLTVSQVPIPQACSVLWLEASPGNRTPVRPLLVTLRFC
jgi:hypothetical protein